jgi:hypothetical protein
MLNQGIGKMGLYPNVSSAAKGSLPRPVPGRSRGGRSRNGDSGVWETEAVEEGLDMSTAMSRASWLIGTEPAKGRQGSAKLPCKKNRTH